MNKYKRGMRTDEERKDKKTKHMERKTDNSDTGKERNSRGNTRKRSMRRTRKKEKRENADIKCEE